MTARRAASARALAVAAVAIGLTVGAAAAADIEPAPGDPIRGQALFVSKGCVECHAVRGTGGRIGPDLGRAAIKGSFPEIAAGLWNHSPAMGEKMRDFRVARPTFEGNELADLIAFLYFLNYFDEPGDPRAGKALFAEKHCIRCHAVGREGGTIGPRLDEIPRGAPPLRIAQALWNHGPAMTNAMRGMGLDPPRFRGSEFLDLVAFLRSQGARAASREFRSAGDPEAGRRLFAEKGCARCHAVFGRGGRVGPDLGRAELRGRSVTQLAATMWNHWPAMSSAMESIGMAPPTFAGDELADVFAYIFLVRYSGPPSDPARGAALYAERGCVRCHGAGGEGGVGPQLRGRMAGEAPEEILQRMWNHAPGMLERMSSQGTTWPRFEAGELADLLTFLAAGLRTTAPARRDAPP
ncbi:MAG TPA: c-type cytochrome [Anaeromyxobacter sp.]|nr:c-type cytochrome [Anaeromyxobacter sp.]